VGAGYEQLFEIEVDSEQVFVLQWV